MDHAVDRFVDGAVSACDENQVGSAFDGALRDLAGMSRTGGGDGIDRGSQPVQQFDRTCERMLTPPESASVRIVDENGLTESRDSNLIIVNAGQKG